METSGKKKASRKIAKNIGKKTERSNSLRPRKKAVGEYRHGDLRNAVLNAAALLVAQRGGPDFALREIAERIGVQHTAIYRHFASKEAILSALAARAFERLGERFARARTACGENMREYLEALADAYFDTVREEPGAYRVMFMRMTQSEPERENASICCFQTLVEGFALSQAIGIVRSDIPAIALATANWAALHGLAMLMIDQRLDDSEKFGDEKALHDTMRQVLREGWLISKPKPRNAAGKPLKK